MTGRPHQPVRVLLVIPEVGLRTGGGISMVGRSITRLLDAKWRAGQVDHRVLSLGQPDDAAEAQRFRESLGDRLRYFGPRRAAFSIAVLREMVRWADLTVFTHLGLGSLQCLLPRAIRPATLTFLHGIEIWAPLGYRKRRGLLVSDLLVTNSQFTAEKARRIHPWLPPVDCCHLGLPEPSAAGPVDLAAALGFAPGEHDVVMVGRAPAGGHKGHRELIAAMERVVAAVPDARLLIVGTGDGLAEHRRQAAETKAAGSIRFTGFLSDEILRELYRHVAVFAMPSRQEGFGLVYLEAMRAGLPCVASNCDAAQEVVLDGQTGLLVDPDNPQDVADALIRLLGDADLRRRLGDAGRQRFLQDFTEEAFHNRFWEALNTAVDRRFRAV